MTELIYHTAYGQALPVVGVTVYDEDVASMVRPAIYDFSHTFTGLSSTQNSTMAEIVPL
jgi:hypothetical protein